jgi:hypothetical protein
MIDSNDLVLIAILKEPKDLAIARMLGWYRIPLRYAPKIVAVDAIAFYQAGVFDSEKWSIRYAARVFGVELVTRADLFQEQADHPRAREEYYKLQLGPVEALARPIEAGRNKRITFLYTTGEQLLLARDIRDLTVAEGNRDVLWRSLRDRACKPNSKYVFSQDAKPVGIMTDVWLDLISLLGLLKTDT